MANESKQAVSEQSPANVVAEKLDPSDALAALAAKLDAAEKRIAELQTATKRGKDKGRRESPAIDAARKQVLAEAKKLGLVIGGTKGWYKLQNKDPEVLRPRISVSKTGELVYFVGTEFAGKVPGMTAITKSSAQQQHIGWARGEVELDAPDALKAIVAGMKLVSAAKLDRSGDADEE